MPRKTSPVNYSARKIVGSAPNPNKRRRGPYKKKPPEGPGHRHMYDAFGGGGCVICGAPRL